MAYNFGLDIYIIQIYQYYYFIHEFTQMMKPVIFMYINVSTDIQKTPHVHWELIRHRHLHCFLGHRSFIFVGSEWFCYIKFNNSSCYLSLCVITH